MYPTNHLGFIQKHTKQFHWSTGCSRRKESIWLETSWGFSCSMKWWPPITTTSRLGTRLLKSSPSTYSLVPYDLKPKSLSPIMNFTGTVIFDPCQGARSSQLLFITITSISQQNNRTKSYCRPTWVSWSVVLAKACTGELAAFSLIKGFSFLYLVFYSGRRQGRNLGFNFMCFQSEVGLLSLTYMLTE